MPRYEILPDVIACDVPNGRTPSRSLRPNVMKTTLLILWYHEGQCATIRGLSARVGAEMSTVACAISSLVKQGYVRKDRRGRNGTMAYLLVDERIRAARTAEPIARRRGDLDNYAREQRARRVAASWRGPVEVPVSAI